jgi:HEPN domain-containing protein
MSAMDRSILRRRIDAEIALAEEAREAGREGRARVCARRAAGLAARSLLEARRIRPRSASAYDALRSLAALDDIPTALRKAAGRLTERVTEGFTLPHEEDPLADALEVIAASLDEGGLEG